MIGNEDTNPGTPRAKRRGQWVYAVRMSAEAGGAVERYAEQHAYSINEAASRLVLTGIGRLAALAKYGAKAAAPKKKARKSKKGKA